MNITQIAAFAKTLKKNKNGTIQQKRKLVAKTNNCIGDVDVTIKPSLLQQTGRTDEGKIVVR
jgi:hypothetical protein